MQQKKHQMFTILCMWKKMSPMLKRVFIATGFPVTKLLWYIHQLFYIFCSCNIRFLLSNSIIIFSHQNCQNNKITIGVTPGKKNPQLYFRWWARGLSERWGEEIFVDTQISILLSSKHKNWRVGCWCTLLGPYSVTVICSFHWYTT